MKNFLFIVVFFVLSVYFCLPNVLESKYLPSNKLHFGLDIRGGLSLILCADFSDDQHEQLTFIQKNAFNTFNSYLDKRTNTIIIDEINISNKIHNLLANIISRNLYLILEDNTQTYFSLSSEYSAKNYHNIINRIIDVVQYRVDATGIQDISIQKHGLHSIIIQIPGVINSNDIKKILLQTGSLKFYLVNTNVTKDDIDHYRIPFGTRLLPLLQNDKQIMIPVIMQPLMSGDMIADAYASTYMGKHIVNFKLTDHGTKKFANITRDNLGSAIAIVLDNKVITAPSINEPIMTGFGQISGNFSFDSANQTAILLRSGALPVPISILQEVVIGPTLGEESINKCSIAVIISCITVMMIMIIVYKYLGIIASLCLICNLTLIIAILSLIEATLTLPSIAGLALTLGMAVDANVLIYERMREEYSKNLSLVQTLQKGYQNALRTILDSNLTTIIVAIFIYIFGSSFTKGFAITLIIGIICSIITAVLFSKILLQLWFNICKPKILFK